MKKKNLTVKKKITVIEQVIKVQAKKEIRRVDHREKRIGRKPIWVRNDARHVVDRSG